MGERVGGDRAAHREAEHGKPGIGSPAACELVRDCRKVLPLAGPESVGAPAVAMPAIYQFKGKQYVVFTAGGNSILTPRVSDEIVAFALPD